MTGANPTPIPAPARDTSTRRVFACAIAVLALAVLALVVFPLFTAFLSAFFDRNGVSLTAFSELASIRGIQQIIQNTAIYVGGVVAFAVVVGGSIAWLNERTDAQISLMRGLVPILPLMVPTIGSTLGYFFLFAPRSGAANILIRMILGLRGDGPVDIVNLAGMIYISGLHLAPFAYLLVSAALRNVSTSLDEASCLAGASPLTTLRRITVPIILPALASAVLIVAIHGVGGFIVPFVIGTGAGVTTVSIQIYRLFTVYPPDQRHAMALSFCLLIVVYMAVFLQQRLTRSLRRLTLGSRHTSSSLIALGRWRLLARGAMVLYLIVVFLPLLGLLITSLAPYAGASIQAYNINSFRIVMANAETRSALMNSLIVATFAATACVMLSALLIYGAERALLKGRSVVEIALMTPAIVPPLIVAVSFLVTFSGPPFRLYGTLAMVALAFFVLFLPDASRASAAAFSQINDELAEASFLSGAGIAKTLRRVVLPQAIGGLFAGWIIVFFSAVNEVTAAAFLGGLSNPLIGQVTVDFYSNGRLSQVAALTLIVTGLTSVVVFIAGRAVARTFRLEAHD